MAPLRVIAVLASLAAASTAASDSARKFSERPDRALGGEEVREDRAPEKAMKLRMMPDKGLKGMGAVCLDGSDAGFYFAPASSRTHANDWQIYFQGGGWCYDEADCLGRSATDLGSSKGWSKFRDIGGIMGSDCQHNPDFCGFNRVSIAYCDGTSFSGDRSKPLLVKGLDGKHTPLYFRGKRVLDAILDTLLTMGLDKAENVLLTGCSAGGLATILHADYVQDRIRAAVPTLKKFRSAPVSGFFLLHNTVEGKPVFADEMKYIYELGNCTHGVNRRCSAALDAGSRWKCIFAEYSYAFTEAPIFLLNSALDSWQTDCIYTSELVPGFPKQNSTFNGICRAAAGWTDCSGNPEKCSTKQIASMNQYITDFVKNMQGVAYKTYTKLGNGAFISSCHMHCEAVSAFWNTIEISGVTMQQALSKWWHSHSEVAVKHVYSPCFYKTSSPRQCNPSCNAAVEGSARLLASAVLV